VIDGTGTIIRRFTGLLDPDKGGADDDGGAEEGLQEGSFTGATEPGKTEAPAEEEGPDTEEPDEPQDPNLDEEDLDVDRGMNRFVWDLQYPGPDVIESAQFSLAYTGGLFAPPGTYTIRVQVGDRQSEVSAVVGLDPRVTTVTERDMADQFTLARQVRDRLTEVHSAIKEIRSIREQIEGILSMLREDEDHKQLVGELDTNWQELEQELKEAEKALIQTRTESGQDPINFPSMLDDQLAYLYSHVTTSYGRPTQGAYGRFQDLVDVTQPVLDRLSGPVQEQVVAFSRILTEAGIGAVITKGR
jgi:hypothetical protein